MSYRVSPENQINYGMGGGRSLPPPGVMWSPRPLTDAEKGMAMHGHKSEYQQACEAEFKSGRHPRVPLCRLARSPQGRKYLRYVWGLMEAEDSQTLMAKHLCIFFRESGINNVDVHS